MEQNAQNTPIKASEPAGLNNGVFYDEDDIPVAILRKGVMVDLTPFAIAERQERVARFKAERRIARRRFQDDYAKMSRGC